MNKLPASSPPDGRAVRRREIENALLTQALCGRLVSPATRARLARYETGELSRETAFADLYQAAGPPPEGS